VCSSFSSIRYRLVILSASSLWIVVIAATSSLPLQSKQIQSVYCIESQQINSPVLLINPRDCIGVFGFNRAELVEISSILLLQQQGIPKVKKSKNWSNNKTYNTYNTFIKVYFQRGTRKRHRFCSWIGKKRVKRSNLVDCGVSSFVESYSIDRIDGNICAIETVDTVFRQSAQRGIDKSKPQVDPTKGSDAIANTVKETKNLVPSLFGIY
jgi:hypothetical protein